MSACIKCFKIVNNYGNIYFGDNPKQLTMEASKSINGAEGFTALDVVNGVVTRRSGRPGEGEDAQIAVPDAELEAQEDVLPF